VGGDNTTITSDGNPIDAQLVCVSMEPAEVLASLESLGSSELLDHFAAPRRERADAIQRYWAQPEARNIAENLILLEIDDSARGVVISLLRGQEDAVGR